MQVTLSSTAKKQIEALPALVQVRIAAAIQALAAYPNVPGVKALKGAHKGTFRVRVGAYRIIFSTATGIVTIISISDRKEAY
jgi:mRNA-degrading endonuclease RelE of RelBE toxin-antitoxin system